MTVEFKKQHLVSILVAKDFIEETPYANVKLRNGNSEHTERIEAESLEMAMILAGQYIESL